MKYSVADRLKELDSLLDAAKRRVSDMRSLDGARNPFSSQAANAGLHDCLKRAMVQADKLTTHFGAQRRRKARL
jgi:hypothetical protein